jgi:hypothetical protein
LYFIEQEEKVIDIKPEQIEDIIELIRWDIRTIKNIRSEDISYLESIEAYFKNTIVVIQLRKKDSNIL